jgi:hypothetical protein
MSFLSILKRRRKEEPPQATPGDSGSRPTRKHRGCRGRKSRQGRWVRRARRLAGDIGPARSGWIYTSVLPTRQVKNYLRKHHRILITDVCRSDPVIAGPLKWRIEWVYVVEECPSTQPGCISELRVEGLRTDA